MSEPPLWRRTSAHSQRLRPTRYFGAFSEEAGESGVYTNWEEVAQLVSEEHAALAHVRYRGFSSLEEAEMFVKPCTRAREGEWGSHIQQDSARGSLVVQLYELTPRIAWGVAECLGS